MMPNDVAVVACRNHICHRCTLPKLCGSFGACSFGWPSSVKHNNRISC